MPHNPKLVFDLYDLLKYFFHFLFSHLITKTWLSNHQDSNRESKDYFLNRELDLIMNGKIHDQ